MVLPANRSAGASNSAFSTIRSASASMDSRYDLISDSVGTLNSGISTVARKRSRRRSAEDGGLETYLGVVVVDVFAAILLETREVSGVDWS